MKIATWNVNGIRARHAQVQEWIARQRPDVVCLQEIKAAPDDIPLLLCDLEGYWCYWHGGKGYSGVALHVDKRIAADKPSFTHPAFDHEHRIVTVEVTADAGTVTIASIYVPNGGKDFPAKMRFLQALDEYASSFQASNRLLVLCGDLNVARTDRDVHPKERKPRAIGQLPEERALLECIIGRGLVDVGRAHDPHSDGLRAPPTSTRPRPMMHSSSARSSGSCPIARGLRSLGWTSRSVRATFRSPHKMSRRLEA